MIQNKTKALLFEICADRMTEKRELIAELACMEFYEVEEFIKEIKKLVHYKDSSQGLWCTDTPQTEQQIEDLCLFKLEY